MLCTMMMNPSMNFMASMNPNARYAQPPNYPPLQKARAQDASNFSNSPDCMKTSPTTTSLAGSNRFATPLMAPAPNFEASSGVQEQANSTSETPPPHPVANYNSSGSTSSNAPNVVTASDGAAESAATAMFGNYYGQHPYQHMVPQPGHQFYWCPTSMQQGQLQMRQQQQLQQQHHSHPSNRYSGGGQPVASPTQAGGRVASDQGCSVSSSGSTSKGNCPTKGSGAHAYNRPSQPPNSVMQASSLHQQEQRTFPKSHTDKAGTDQSGTPMSGTVDDHRSRVNDIQMSADNSKVSLMMRASIGKREGCEPNAETAMSTNVISNNASNADDNNVSNAINNSSSTDEADNADSANNNNNNDNDGSLTNSFGCLLPESSGVAGGALGYGGAGYYFPTLSSSGNYLSGSDEKQAMEEGVTSRGAAAAPFAAFWPAGTAGVSGYSDFAHPALPNPQDQAGNGETADSHHPYHHHHQQAAAAAAAAAAAHHQQQQAAAAAAWYSTAAAASNPYAAAAAVGAHNAAAMAQYDPHRSAAAIHSAFQAQMPSCAAYSGASDLDVNVSFGG